MLCEKLGLPKGTDIPDAIKLAMLTKGEPQPEDNRYKRKAVKGPIQVGKALSEWHKRRMIENSGIKTVMTKEQRLRAIGPKSDFPRDRVCTYMTQYAEEIFEPKRILSDSDWLKRYREGDQYFEHYQRGNGNIKWLSPQKNKIYLFIVDNSFTQEQINNYQLYCSAFFMGVDSV